MSSSIEEILHNFLTTFVHTLVITLDEKFEEFSNRIEEDKLKPPLPAAGPSTDTQYHQIYL